MDYANPPARSDGPVQPGDNPNVRNAQRRKGPRPKTKNSSGGQNTGMRLGWIDPLPKVDPITPIGFDPNPESFSAGDFELKFSLPGDIASPYVSLVNSVSDRLGIDNDEITQVEEALTGMAYFKAARQLYSTMLDYEKSVNQPLKAIYYDETPIPTHLGAALGIIGHLETKVGKMLVKHASTLFKRWIVQGLKEGGSADYANSDPETYVWGDADGYSIVRELATARIETLTDQTYQVTVGTGPNASRLTVSMPKLRQQRLEDYYAAINDLVPDADHLRDLVSLLQMSQEQFRRGQIPNGRNFVDAMARIGLVKVDDSSIHGSSSLRLSFEDWMANYTTGIRWRLESLFHVAPPPAGSNGYGAQLVQGDDTTARWQMPLSDSDLSMGFLFSPNVSFNMYPRFIGYSKRRREDMAARYALKDAKSYAQD